jgi:hypothetical protein
MQPSRRNPARPPALTLPVLAAALFLLVASVGTASARTLASSQPRSTPPVALIEEDGTPVPTSVATPISKARAAMTNAVRYTQHHRFRRASLALANVRLYVGKAHTAGMAEIGAPPADPESDVPPGPVSVIAVLGLEHSVVLRSARLFNGLTRAIGLGSTLSTAMTLRTTMLETIIPLDPEGDGADYADGMADTLPIYTAEVKGVATVLVTGSLTATGRARLKVVLAGSKATRAMVTAAYGGGE